MRHLLVNQLLAVSLMVPVTAWGQHHHSSSGGASGLGSLFGGGSSMPSFQPQHHQPAFQPQHHQNNQPTFNGQSHQSQNRQGAFQQQNNFQPQAQNHQTNRPVLQQPQNMQANRPMAQQPQNNHQQPQNNQTNRPLVQQPQNNPTNRPLVQQSQNNQTNRPPGQQPQNNHNGGPLVQHHPANASQGSTPSQLNNAPRAQAGVASSTATIHTPGNRPNTQQAIPGQTQPPRPIANVQPGAQGRPSPSQGTANTAGNVPTHRPGSTGQGTATSHQSQLDAAKQAAAHKAQEKLGGNQTVHTGVQPAGAQSAITRANPNQTTQQPQNVLGAKAHANGSGNSTAAGAKNGAAATGLPTSGEKGHLTGGKPIGGSDQNRPQGHATAHPTDVRKAQADKQAHDLAVKQAQQAATKARGQGSPSGKPVATNGKAGNGSVGGAATTSGQVGVKKISTSGQVANGKTGQQQPSNQTGTKTGASSQTGGKVASTSAGTGGANGSKTNGGKATGANSNKSTLASTSSADKARDRAVSQLPKDKQETVKNKAAQNTSSATASRRPVNHQNGAGKASTVNKLTAHALTGDVRPVKPYEAATEKALLNDSNPAVRQLADDLLNNRPLTQVDRDALAKVLSDPSTSIARMANLQNLVARNDQINALSASVTGTSLLGGLFPFPGTGLTDPTAGFVPTPAAELATGIIQIIDGATGGSLGLSSLVMGGPIAVVPEELSIGEPFGPLASLSGYCMSIQDNCVPDYQNAMIVPISYSSGNVTTTFRPILDGQPVVGGQPAFDGQVEDLSQTSEPLIEPVTEEEQTMFDKMYAGIDLDTSTMRILEVGWHNSSAAKRRADYETFMSNLQPAGTGTVGADAIVDQVPQSEPVTLDEREMFQRMYADLGLDEPTLKLLDEGWQNSTSAQRKADYDAFMAQISAPADSSANAITARVRGEIGAVEVAASAATGSEILAQQIVPITAVTHRTRFLRLANISGEPIQLHIQYYTEDQNNQWNWFPTVGQDGQDLSVELDAGDVTDLEIDGWRLNASKVRIWGSAPSGREWKKFKTQELVLVPETDAAMRPAYLADEKQTFCFTIK